MKEKSVSSVQKRIAIALERIAAALEILASIPVLEREVKTKWQDQ